MLLIRFILRCPFQISISLFPDQTIIQTIYTVNPFTSSCCQALFSSKRQTFFSSGNQAPNLVIRSPSLISSISIRSKNLSAIINTIASIFAISSVLIPSAFPVMSNAALTRSFKGIVPPINRHNASGTRSFLVNSSPSSILCWISAIS